MTDYWDDCRVCGLGTVDYDRGSWEPRWFECDSCGAKFEIDADSEGYRDCSTPGKRIL